MSLGCDGGKWRFLIFEPQKLIRGKTPYTPAVTIIISMNPFVQFAFSLRHLIFAKYRLKDALKEFIESSAV